MQPRIVAALGGNALLRRGEPLEADLQRANVKRAVQAVEYVRAAEGFPWPSQEACCAASRP
jgi:carbamate kinase